VNPLAVAGALRDDYLKLLRTTYAPRQSVLRDAFNRELEREGFLTREPFVALAQPYRYGAPITEAACRCHGRQSSSIAAPWRSNAW